MKKIVVNLLYSIILTLSFTEEGGSDTSSDETSESFAFALVNGALGVFEVQGRRIRDFRYFLTRVTILFAVSTLSYVLF